MIRGFLASMLITEYFQILDKLVRDTDDSGEVSVTNMTADFAKVSTNVNLEKCLSDSNRLKKIEVVLKLLYEVLK